MTKTRVFGRVGTASWAASFLFLVAAVGCQDAENPSEAPQPANPPEPVHDVDTTFPASLALTVTAEVDVDTPVIGSAANSMSPAIAFDGTNYLVVWADQRLSRDEDIFATRVSSTGQILDATGITIAATAGRQLNPRSRLWGTSTSSRGKTKRLPAVPRPTSPRRS